MFKIFLILAITVAGLLYINFQNNKLASLPVQAPENISFSAPPPSSAILALPQSKVLVGGSHVFQTFNNCGPASLSIALSFLGIQKSQEELGQKLRPYQVSGGDNDDKSVTLTELAKEAGNYKLATFHRPNGDIELLKKLVSLDLPVITRTWLKEDEDIGHYRVVKGFDDDLKVIIQDDSYQGKDLKYSYNDFNKLWSKFNFEYLVLVPENKKIEVENILGEDLDIKTAWKKAIKFSENELSKNPDDIYARFNLVVARYNIGEFQKSIEEFEKVENDLPFRTLWYQIEPIAAYYQVGNYQRVFEITDKVFNQANRAYSEAYILRGLSFLELDDKVSAQKEFEKAKTYNKYIQIPDPKEN